MGTSVTDVKPGTMNFKHLVFAVLLSALALTYGSTINEDNCKECVEEQKQAFEDCKDAEEPKESVEEKIKDICSKEDFKTCPTCSKPEGECKKCAEAQKEAVKKCKKDEDWDKECAAKAIKEVCDSNPDWMKCPTCKKPEDKCKRCAAAEMKAIAGCKKDPKDPKKCAIDA